MRYAAWFVLVLSACGDDGSSDPSRGRDRHTRDRLEHKLQLELAEKQARVRQYEAERSSQQLEQLTAQVATLEEQVTLAERDLIGATTQAGRDTARVRLEQLMTEVTEVKLRIDRVKTGSKPKCPPDDPLC